MKNFLFLFLAFFCALINAQNIKTIQLIPVGSKTAVPIARLGSALELTFDDLDADNKEYQYKIEHMTYDWKPSNLQSNQYINGFEQNYIIDISNSFNTLQSYSHYKLRIPNQNTTITKSGNYLLSILDEYDEVVFTRRFVLYEDITTVGVNVIRSRDIKTIETQQTVQFIVNHENLFINNPSQEIKIQLLQNSIWETAVTNLTPLFIRNNQLVYNHTLKTNFWGGNEYFNFDNKYIRNTNVNIAKTERRDLFHNYLYTNVERNGKPYTYFPDINGQFTIRTLDAEDEATEADYAMMHFSLEAYSPYDKDVYVYGAFNNFQLNEENKMTYNDDESIYEASILLKQGFYNYTYVTVDANGKIDPTEINGSFFQTENVYNAIIYYRPFGGLFDRVVGVGLGYFDQNR
ncbi:type IX secretion system plug protein [Tenacibaculum jejuense]|nr:DUF5103 domain-containing protein [Tenacibaculum jejuense]